MGDNVQRMWAAKFAKQIPVLVRMERDCYSKLESIQRRINVFWKEDEKLRQNILRWVNMLYSTGQKIRDWNINFLNWIETDENMPYDLTPEEQEKRIKDAVINFTSEQLKEVERYEKMYPKKSIKY